MAITLIGLNYSVYTRIARLVLEYHGVQYTLQDADPFHEKVAEHPFNRVPILIDDTAQLYETRAILHYVDAAYGASRLTPKHPLARAKMEQVISIIDNYGYVSMVRQVFGQSVFRPLIREPVDDAIVETGLSASRPVLQTLESIATEADCLCGQTLTLADLHLAPILDYFQRAPAWAEMLSEYPALSNWWATMRQRPEMTATEPVLPS